VAAVVAVLAGSSLSAHRRDEYLQAARLTIDPDRIEIALDLTPGIAVAGDVLARIDANADESISPGEAHEYLASVVGAIDLEVDGTRLMVKVSDSELPDVGAVRNGEGTLRIRAVAVMPRLGEGVHRLRFRNSHRPDIGAYLVNPLIPASDRVTLGTLRRDVHQRELTIEYSLRADAKTRARDGLLAGFLVALIGASSLVWRRT